MFKFLSDWVDEVRGPIDIVSLSILKQRIYRLSEQSCVEMDAKHPIGYLFICLCHAVKLGCHRYYTTIDVERVCVMIEKDYIFEVFKLNCIDPRLIVLFVYIETVWIAGVVVACVIECNRLTRVGHYHRIAGVVRVSIDSKDPCCVDVLLETQMHCGLLPPPKVKHAELAGELCWPYTKIAIFLGACISHVIRTCDHSITFVDVSKLPDGPLSPVYWICIFKVGRVDCLPENLTIFYHLLKSNLAYLVHLIRNVKGFLPIVVILLHTESSLELGCRVIEEYADYQLKFKVKKLEL